MSTTVISERVVDASPQMKARVAGGLWLTCIVTAIFGFVAGSSVIVANDAAATATNILANESLYRLGFAADLISGLSYLGVTALLYYLLKPAGRSLSLLAAFFGLAGVAIGAAGNLNQLVPLVLLSGDHYLSALTTSQLQTMALIALKLRLQLFSIGMVFFGFQCLLAGCLIVRSTFLPRLLGVLLAMGGASYVIVSFANFLAPALGVSLAPFIMPIALVGEGALTGWLLAKGVNVQRWREQASAANH